MGSLSVAPGYNDSLSMDTVSNWPSFKKWRAFRASNPYDPDWRAGLACGAPSDHLPDDRHWRRDARRRGRLQDEAQRDPHDDDELTVATLLVAPATSSRSPVGPAPRDVPRRPHRVFGWRRTTCHRSEGGIDEALEGRARADPGRTGGSAVALPVPATGCH